jgi:hypothetical protein
MRYQAKYATARDVSAPIVHPITFSAKSSLSLRGNECVTSSALVLRTTGIRFEVPDALLNV